MTDQTPETPDEIVFPEDLTAVTDDDLKGLQDKALDAFNDLYGDGTKVTQEQHDALKILTDGLEKIRTEKTGRDEAAATRASEAAALAERAGINTPSATATEDEDTTSTNDDAPVETEPEAAPAEAKELEAVTASSNTKVSLRDLRRPKTPARQATTDRSPDKYGNTGMRDIVLAAPNAAGLQAGQGMDWADMGRAVDRRLASFPEKQYQNAARMGRSIKERHPLAIIQKPTEERLTVTSTDAPHVDEIFSNARNELALPGGKGLVAAGGWCAPSETIYDLCELESRDGLISVPEVTVTRGGLNFTTGPDFSTLYNDTGFCYTEAEDIAGDYDGAGGGTKPCFTVGCPEFTDQRLGLCGVCITAGLLQSRGYPELISRVLRGALVAHDHRVSANFITAMVAGSTAIVMPTTQVGATAPVLASIELQVEHMRYSNRLGRNATIEAVFPYWVRGVIRADLSRRLGVDLLSVSDSMIDAWFTQRGVAAQYVYDWQDISTTAASGFFQFPTTVQFLLYPAGTWVKGTSDIITLDNIYDSVGLGTNDFTALFTEEGWMAAKLCTDSRVVTVGVCADGATAAGVDIACDGTLVTP